MKKTVLLLIIAAINLVALAQNEEHTVGNKIILSTEPTIGVYCGAVYSDITNQLVVPSNTTPRGMSVFSNQQTTLDNIQHIDFGTTNDVYGSALSDLDNDGDLDLITAGPNGASTSPNNIYYWDEQEDQYKYTGSTYSFGQHAIYGKGVVTGDFNNDNKTDIVWFTEKYYYSRKYGIVVGINNTTSPDNITFESMNKYHIEDDEFRYGNTAYSTGDFNADGNLDIVTVGRQAGDTYRLLLGNGDGTFTLSKGDSAGDNFEPMYISTGDLNNDGKIDLIITRNDYTNRKTVIELYLCNDDYTYSKTQLYSYSYSYANIAYAVDINKDNHLDIACITYQNRKVNIYLNQGDGIFKSKSDIRISVEKDPRQLFFDDLVPGGYLEVITVANYNEIAYYEITKDTPTNISNNESQFKAYPNPTNGLINIPNYTGSVKVVDLTGNTVYFTPSFNHSINISNQPSGVYFLILEKNGQAYQQKIIKK
ncbi:FG-GAP-like repeat-containing protein [Saccharicrinis aurantiacus]|uniref:FG-GAP-like repeat-containing protein n=1 Tax=Saccharicrinis aurantiacus TaxID=1849719 RepID=UPI002493B628|nr:FG-GAP-like repeat-containing protein [Saccharicrinis aurantiacus]